MLAIQNTLLFAFLPPESDTSIAQPLLCKKRNGNSVDSQDIYGVLLIFTLPERYEYDMLCKQN